MYETGPRSSQRAASSNSADAGVPDEQPADASTRVTARRTPADTATLLVLAISVVLRLALALVNTQANDEHLPVIEVIAFEGRFPERLELWEAFQPKLYHTTVALLWRLTPTASPAALNVVAQLVSALAGMAALLLIWHFLRQQPLAPTARLFAVALVALNPQLIGISAQATNDAFVILFATLTLYFGYSFFRHGGSRTFAALVLASILTGVSKGNGLVIIIAVLLTFAAAYAWYDPAVWRTRRRLTLYLLAYGVIVIPAVAELGPYGYHYREYGSPFVTNWEPAPRPNLLTPTYVGQPGITSVAHGLFTFRLLDLMRTPYSNHDRSVFPAHRTSLWSRIHAQTHFVHFEQWPRSWATHHPLVLNLGRALLLLALFPTALLVWRIGSSTVDVVRRVTDRRRTVPLGTVLLLLAVAGSIGFLVVYALYLRDYSSMKPIFAFPGLLGFALLLGQALDRFQAWAARRRLLQVAAGAVLTALLVGYVLDVGILTGRLLHARIGL